MNKLFFALIAALPLLAGCFWKKETPAPVATEMVQEEAQTAAPEATEDADMHEAEEHDEENDEK